MSDQNVTNWTRHDDAAVENAIRRGASRRDLLRMLMASGVAVMAGGTLLGRAQAQTAATPKKGGHLVTALWHGSTADTLDPAKAASAPDYIRCASSYNRLTFLDENSEIQMELAERIDTDDAQTWTVHLKPGITFHDGSTLTSADVVFSLARHLDEATGSKVNSIAKQMSEITAIDPLTLRIVLSSPNADLTTILALNHFMIVKDGTTDFNKGIGTGPFIVETFEPGVRSVHQRNPNYFKPGLPHLDSHELFAIPDDASRVNALVSDQIQIAGSINPRAVRQLEASGKARGVAENLGNYTNMNMRLDMDPGQKAGFAEGMKYLMDRETILQSALRGMGEIGNDQPVPPINRYHNPNVLPRAYDPDRAKSLFEKAGVLGQKIPVIASDAALSSVDMATIIQASGRGIGLDLDVQRMPADGYWSNYWLKSPIHFGNINPRPTPDILFSLLYKSDAAWNESQYKSEKFDSMLIEARGMLDEEKRTEIYWEMQEMVANEAGTAIPCFIADIAGLSNRVKGWKPNPLGGMMGYVFPEYCWLEDA
ncbi:ABC transporter substrate-binding protein [Phaeovulum sp. W22_SRMD_FR3]|uniref:ABC transporter substrate-binding protein n=1 Tax=Phaeovulum sp. W22_SRMD_FR3 TaxID=3240274 RepID=UPI003F99677F